MVYHYYIFFLNFSLALLAVLMAFRFTKDLVNEVHLINEHIKAKQIESDIIKQFIVVIDLHCDTKQLSE